MELKNKTVVVTGVSKGIGRALVDLYLNEGCLVIGLGRNSAQTNHPQFHFIKTDVRSEDEVSKAFEQIRTEISKEIHILINNAGLGYFGKIENLEMAQMRQMFETNVYSVFYTAKEVVPMMKTQEYGHIFNIASTAGLESYPEVAAYCGSKFAVRAISGSMYKELRDFRIKVTCVYPGSVKTDFFRNNKYIEPHDYMLLPEDVAQMIVHASQTPDNFHQVNLEVRPLQPKGPRKSKEG
ncbi:MAG: SDR family oxidoreductase [Bacteroidia bacterium]